MQVNQFIHYLDHSKELLDVSETEITSIIKEFPYCQTGQLMSAINLNLNNSILFEEQLKRAASICPDRTKLFEHLHQETEDEVLIEEAVAQIDVQINEYVKIEVKEESNVKEEPKVVSEDKFVPVKGEDELALLEKEYLTTAISSTILLESDEANKIESKIKEVEKEIDLFDEQVNHSFSSWLKHYNADEQDVEIEGSNKKNADIIDRFIQEDPRIKPKKTEFYSPTNMARLSVTDSGIVSETLALIHVDQGNFQGAIDAYEKLMLKNPKKSSYFAAQIKILKQNLK